MDDFLTSKFARKSPATEMLEQARREGATMGRNAVAGPTNEAAEGMARRQFKAGVTPSYLDAGVDVRDPAVVGESLGAEGARFQRTARVSNGGIVEDMRRGIEAGLQAAFGPPPLAYENGDQVREGDVCTGPNGLLMKVLEIGESVLVDIPGKDILEVNRSFVKQQRLLKRLHG